MASQTTIHQHNYQHFEDLQMSSIAFYTLLKNMITDYRYPNVSCTAVTLKEAGIFSSKREYLRISKQRYSYYVCASPFGKSFFISWWLQEDANTSANIAQKFGWLGRTVASHLESKTFYELDSEAMFTSSITSIIKAAIEKVKLDKGFRQDVPVTSI